MSKKYNIKQESGFSLIELLMVVGIIGVLASIAVPAYNGYIIKGKRSEGRAYISDLAARQERFYSDCNQYATGIGTGAASYPCTGGIMRANGSSESGEYNFTSFTMGANNQGYTITITPTFTDDKCTTLTMDQTGAKGFSGTGPQDICW